jgi:hypothetical protein
MKTFLKENKAQLFLPLLLLPFVVLLFYILGGGTEVAGKNGSGDGTNTNPAGANFQIPQADQSIEILDKPQAYEQQSTQSATMDYQILEGAVTGDSLLLAENSGPDTLSLQIGSKKGDLNPVLPNELLEHIRQKEVELKKELMKPDEAPKASATRPKKDTPYSPPGSAKESQKEVAYEPKADAAATRLYPETGIGALDQVFDENLALSARNDSLKFYLEQVQSRLQEIEKQQAVSFSLEKPSSSGFDKDQQEVPLIKAEVYETTTVLNGNRVKLRLLEECRIGGTSIARNTFVYGICKINNERLHITVTRIPVKENFLPVDLDILDLDGLSGLYVPDNAARKVSQEVGGSTNTSSLFGVTSDPLTYAGIRAADRTAQTLLKRVRLKRVTVKKNTLVYLVNNNQ